MVDLNQAILALHPTAEFSHGVQGYSKISWHSKDIEQPTESECEAKLAELQAAEPIRLLRADRDKLLAESDWTALADSALTSEASANWKLYRQKLRDLPSGLTTEAKVKNAKWPAKPV